MPSKLSTVAEWLQWLETLHSKKIDMSLGRLKAVIKMLPICSEHTTITVGGTNGKGSCIALLESIYLHAGFRVGVYTSPHLWHFNERIRFNGSNISDADLVDMFVAIDNARTDITLSYFEYATLAALVYFSSLKPDVVLLEVGLGGRLDAVNAVDADVSLIASVAIDHEEWLGKTREEIGYEKAGIMRVNKPGIVAERDCPKSVINYAQKVGALMKRVGHHYDCIPGEVTWNYEGANGVMEELPIPNFGGNEQLTNAAGCVAVVEASQSQLPVSHDALVMGLKNAQIKARSESRKINGVIWVFDVAHNPAAAEALSNFLENHPIKGKTIAILAVMADKDLKGILEPMLSKVDEWIFTHTGDERCATTESMQDVLPHNVSSTSFMNINMACEWARNQTSEGDRVLVYGSFYLVGPAMTAVGLYSSSS